MAILLEQKELLIAEMQKLRDRFELSKTVGPDYFEPGMMEYLDQSFGSVNEATGEMILRFECRGTRYEGRTERIENVHLGDEIRIEREKETPYDPNSFVIMDQKGQSLGNVPAAISSALAPLYDSGNVVFEIAFVSFVEPISKRSRHAKQAILFVELHLKLVGIQ